MKNGLTGADTSGMYRASACQHIKFLTIIAIALASANLDAGAQWSRDSIQLNGFATQGFIYTTNNNYIGMNTTAGSPAWTEGALTVNDRLAPKLRAGVQVHVTRLGAFGGYTPTVDWALVDYSPSSFLGIHAGKVKIKWGLFNNVQDADPSYLWSLLPETEYGIDVRATNLAQYGAEAYGRLPLGKSLGSLEYSAYYGFYRYARHDGYNASFAEQGLTFTHPATGVSPGMDLRWSTPLNGLRAGGSLLLYNAHGHLTDGTYRQPLTFWPTAYAEYNHKKCYAAAEYSRVVQYQTVSTPATGPSTTGSDTRTWFVMGAYHLTGRLQAGAYYTRTTTPSAGDNTDPANYFTDKTVSVRYDLTRNLYGKLEGHFIKGNAVGFYDFNNPNGLTPRTNGLVAKIGVTF